MRFSVLFLLYFSLSFGQQSERQADSLKSILKTSSISFKERIKILNKLTQFYGEFDFRQAKSLNNQIYILSKGNSYYNGLGFYYQNLADNKMYTEDFKAAEQLAKKAQQYFIKAKNTNSFLLSIYTNCFALDFQGQYKKGKQLALQTVNQYENSPNNDYIAELYYYLSTLYNDEEKTTTAFMYVNKSLDLYLKKNNNNGVFKCYYQLASISVLSGMYLKSIGYLDKCQKILDLKFDKKIENKILVQSLYARNYIKIKEYKKALRCCELVELYLKKWNSNELQLRNDLALIKVNTKLGSYKRAQYYIRRAEALTEFDESFRNEFYIAKGNYFLATKDYSKALEIGQYNYSKDSLDTENLNLLVASAAALKDYSKAFEYQKKVLRENEKDYNLKKNDQVAEYEALFQLKDKDLTIKNQSLQVVKKETEVQRQKGYVVIFLVISVALFIVFLLLGYNFQIKRKSIRLLHAKNEELNHLNEIVASSLKEKEILLKEIHHRVKNNLQLVMSLLNIQAQDSQNISIADFLEKGQSRIATMSLIHQNLYLSDNFSQIDFQTYLENLVANIKNTFNENKVAIAIDTHGNSFDLDTAIPLGLIINEIVCNALKHAFPKEMEGRIQIAIQKKEFNLFELQIGDNGVGTTAIQKENSIGLELVSLLVMQLRGKIEKINQLGTNYNIQFHPSTEY
jgi:two-component system, sensor histidine kinase PdtaS